MSTPVLPRYAPLVLRLGLAAVYMWFGVSQWTSPATWTSMVPDWATGMSGMPADTIIQLNSILEIGSAILFALGFGVRYIAFILFVHLLVIARELGVSATGIRDFGLATSTLALSLFGDDEFSLAVYIRNRRKDTALNS